MAKKKTRKQRGATKEQLAMRAARLDLARKMRAKVPAYDSDADRAAGDTYRPRRPHDVPPRLYAFHPDSPVQLTERGRQELMARRAAELLKGTGEDVTLATLVDPATAVDGAVALLRLAGLHVNVQRVRVASGGVVTSLLVLQ